MDRSSPSLDFTVIGGDRLLAPQLCPQGRLRDRHGRASPEGPSPGPSRVCQPRVGAGRRSGNPCRRGRRPHRWLTGKTRETGAQNGHGRRCLSLLSAHDHNTRHRGGQHDRRRRRRRRCARRRPHRLPARRVRPRRASSRRPTSPSGRPSSRSGTTIVLIKISGKPIWWIILLLIPIVNIVIMVLVYHGLSTSFGHGAGFTVGLIFLSIIFLYILGYDSKPYQGATGRRAASAATPPPDPALHETAVPPGVRPSRAWVTIADDDFRHPRRRGVHLPDHVPQVRRRCADDRVGGPRR